MAGTLTTTVAQDGRINFASDGRQHTVYVDRTVAKRSAEPGPAGGEYVLVGLAGCFTSQFLAAIAAQGPDHRAVSVSASGTFDGTPERSTSFEMIETAVAGDSDEVGHVVTVAERSCRSSQHSDSRHR